MNRPLLSVIIPVYNVKNYLTRCLDSVINQSYKNLEIIIVDDGSIDGSGEICDEYAVKDRRIKAIHQRNSGVSDARNAALRECIGEYISFIDADDWLEPDIYSIAIKSMIIEDADVLLFGFLNAEINAEGHYKFEKCRFWKSNREYDVICGIKQCNGILGYSGILWNKVIKRDLIFDKYFDNSVSYGEDLLYLAYAFEKCNTAIILHRYGYNYFINREGSAVTTKLNKSYIEFLQVSELVYHILSERGCSVTGVERIRIAVYTMCKKIKFKEIEKYDGHIRACRKIIKAISWKDMLDYIKDKDVQIKKKFVLLAILFDLKKVIKLNNFMNGDN